jgi:hypothetical protein
MPVMKTSGRKLAMIARVDDDHGRTNFLDRSQHGFP